MSYTEGDFSQAIEYAERAIVENARTGDLSSTDPDEYLDHNLLVNALRRKTLSIKGLYDISKRASDLKDALTIIHQSDTLLNRLGTRISRDADKIVLAGLTHEVCGEGIDLAHRLYGLTGDDTYLSLAYYFAERSKSNVLIANLSEKRARRFGDVPEEFLQLEHDLLIDQAYWRSELIYFETEEPEDKAQREVVVERLFDTNARLDSIQLALEDEYPDYYQLKYGTEISPLSDIQKKLSLSQAILEYFESDSVLYLIGLTREDIWIEQIVKDTIFDQTLGAFNQSLDPALILGNPEEAYQRFAESSHALYQSLLASALERLSASVEQLTIVPDGGLSTIPWDILLRTPASPSSWGDYSQLDYLNNNFSVSYSYSANLLFQGFYDARSKADGALLAFAPSYPDNAEALDYDLGPVFRDEFVPLKWTSQEIGAINERIDGRTFSELRATEGAFKANANNYRIIHLAMHAFVDHKDPMLSRLAFASEADTIEDGLLYTYELYNMDIPAEMVVLSACNTGLGELRRGEGVMSLGRAFAYAGCPSIVMSHWSVDDESTSMLMELFYKHLSKGMNKAEALRQAKMDFLEASDPIRSHPYFWGGFVVIGSPEALFGSRSSWIGIVTVMIFLALILSTVFYLRSRGALVNQDA
ncbi:MAG: CHAT domain-containing protein [Bacteroidota bacterium]